MTRHHRLRSALLTALVLTTASVACSAGRSESSAARAASESIVPGMADTPAAATPAAELAQGHYAVMPTSGSAAPRDAQPKRMAIDGRKIIRTGDLALTVDSYEPVRQEIETLLRASRGFIANAQVGHSEGRVTEATLTLRVPTDGFEDLVARLAKLGTVISESSSAQDVTDQWVDVTARLANAKKLEGRLVELVATQAGNVTQLLEVERELARVREQVELFEGHLHVLEDQTALSTLTLRIQTRAPFVAAVTPSFGGDAGRALSASWAGVTGLARDLALGVIGFLPWLPLLALGFYFARRAYRRYLVPNKRSPASPSPGTM